MIRLVKSFHPDQWKWRNDPEVMKYIRQSEPISEESHQKWVIKQSQDDTVRYFGIELSEENKVKGFIKKPEIIGYCGLSQIPIGDKIGHRSAEYSMLIAPGHQGKGYGRIALEMLLRFGFNSLGLEVIWGEILETNDAGLKLADKFRFQKEGVLRCRYLKDGMRVSSVMVSLLRGEFVKAGSA